MTDAQAVYEHLDAELGNVLVGLEDVRRMLIVALIAGGHVLIEGVPGLGKTLLASTFATAIGGAFQRVQGTADLMPSDLTGQNVFDQRTAQFSFRPGPIFADVLLADEINRAGPKTQSALLEAMAERHVTIDRVRHPLPRDFLVIATQNPHEFEGTYPLPESQLDRFMFALSVRYPERGAEREVLLRYGAGGVAAPPKAAALPAALLDGARREAANVYVSDALNDYLVDLVRATRSHAAVALGVSTRGLIALSRAARVLATMRGGDYVGPDDVKLLAPSVLAHRLALKPEAVLDGVTGRDVVEAVLGSTPVPV